MILWRKLALLIFLCVFCTSISGCLQQERLIIESPGQTERNVPLGQSRIFSLRYTHSVEKTPVVETFRVLDGGHFLLISTAYKSYGVGLPSLPSEGKLTLRDGWFLLENLQREYQDIRLRVGPEAAVLLEQDKQSYPLHEWYPAGSLVIIRQELSKKRF